jgi:hypothetical protein
MRSGNDYETGGNGFGLALADTQLQTGGAIGNPAALRPADSVIADRQWRKAQYDEQYALDACQALESGITLREHCRIMKRHDPKYPDPSTFYCWAVENVQGFATRYAYARRMLLQHWAEEIIEIAEDGRNDFMERRRQDGTITMAVDHECVQRSKLRIDTRRWLLSKLLPHEYGDKIMHQQLGANGMPVDPPSAVSPIDLSVELRGWKPRD